MSVCEIHSDVVRLEGAQRLAFLPALFGGDYVLSEASIYAYASRYCPDYEGGFWHFNRISADGADYMAPDVETLTFCNPDNEYEQTVSGDVAGIILTALVLNHRCWHHSHHDRDELVALFYKRHESLTAFSDTHPDAGVIWRALD